jgi:hypothetical protein
MTSGVSGSLRSALAKLESDRARIDRQIAAVRTAVIALDGGGPRASMTRRPRRRRMSAAARKAVGARMKAYWAKRRAATRSSTRPAKSQKPAVAKKKSGTAG